MSPEIGVHRSQRQDRSLEARRWVSYRSEHGLRLAPVRPTALFPAGGGAERTGLKAEEAVNAVQAEFNKAVSTRRRASSISTRKRLLEQQLPAARRHG